MGGVASSLDMIMIYGIDEVWKRCAVATEPAGAVGVRYPGGKTRYNHLHRELILASCFPRTCHPFLQQHSSSLRAQTGYCSLVLDGVHYNLA